MARGGRVEDRVADQATAARKIPQQRKHRDTDELPEQAREWVETHGVPPEDLVELACRSMKRVATENDWWHDRLNDLRYRLGDIAAP